jgi:hypothetical protein
VNSLRLSNPGNTRGEVMGNEKHKESVSILIEQKKIRWYWIGVVTYFLILLNAGRFAYQVRYEVLIIGAILNAVMIIGFVLLLRKSYRRIRGHADEW